MYLFLAPLLLVFISAAAAQERPPGVVVVDAAGLVELAGREPALVLIDARLAQDRREGYIEGSLSLPNVDTDCAALARHLPSPDRPVAFYCNGVRCGRSLDAANRARACGYTRVHWFRGGFEEWVAGGYPVLRD